jgi:hypothetical protein
MNTASNSAILEEALGTSPLFEKGLISLIGSFIQKFEDGDEEVYENEKKFRTKYPIHNVEYFSKALWIQIIKKCYKYSRTHYLNRYLDCKIQMCRGGTWCLHTCFPRILIDLAIVSHDLSTCEAVIVTFMEYDDMYNVVYFSVYEKMENMYENSDVAGLQKLVDIIDMFQLYRTIYVREGLNEVSVDFAYVILDEDHINISLISKYFGSLKAYLSENLSKDTMWYVRMTISNAMLGITDQEVIDYMKSEEWI